MSKFYLSCTKCKQDGDIRLYVHAPHCMTCGNGQNILHSVNPPCPPYDMREPLRGVRHENELYESVAFKASTASIQERAAWHCPDCKPAPLKLIRDGLVCMLCGQDAQVRPSWYAAQRQAARPDVIEPMPVRGRPPALYGCHNVPRDVAPPYLAPSGHMLVMQNEAGLKVTATIRVEVPQVMSTDCRYDKSATDSKCAGCDHNKGASYADPH